MNWRELKETIGFVTFKNDYIKIFEYHHPQLLKKIEGYRQARIFKTDKHEEQSILNYINTNVSAYSIIVNETLKKINFDPTTKEGYNEMMDYVINNKWYWMGILPKINDKILYTSSKGGEKENLVKKKLNDYFSSEGKYKIVPIGELGNLTDMNGGVDMIIKDKNGKEFKIQIKSCSSITLTDDKTYNIKYNGINKLYNNIDYIIFVVGENVNIFNNKKIMKDEYGYKCDKNGLRMVL
jgi:hypothetical protein